MVFNVNFRKSFSFISFFFQNIVQSIIYRETIVDVILYNTISTMKIKVVP
jgi:hypothetical protein